MRDFPIRTARWLLVTALLVLIGGRPEAVRGQATPTESPEADRASYAAVASFDRAWRIIHETHFDTAFGGVDWVEVRRELRPRVLAASDPVEVRELIREMLTRLEQSHFHLLPGDGMRRTAGPDAAEEHEGEGRLGHFGSIPAAMRADTIELSGGGWVGRVAFESWMPQLATRLHAALEAMRSADGIVIDLRGNGGGLAAMVVGVAGHFVRDSVHLGTQRTRRGALRFTAVPRHVGVDGTIVAPFAGPLAILVDERTGSASEVFAAGMQASGRGRVFGRTTAGIVLPATIDVLPNGDLLLHAVADFVAADGTRLEGRGVIPDRQIASTRREGLDGRDPVLEAAVRWIEDERRAAGWPAGSRPAGR